jgi:hypothetical protein
LFRSIAIVGLGEIDLATIAGQFTRSRAEINVVGIAASTRRSVCEVA